MIRTAEAPGLEFETEEREKKGGGSQSMNKPSSL